MVGVIMYGIVVFMHIINGLAVMCGKLDHKYIPINIFSYATFACWIVSGQYLMMYLIEWNIQFKIIHINMAGYAIFIEFLSKLF